jgi:hypothetical protein
VIPSPVYVCACSLDIILRHEEVDQAHPGDKIMFIGTLIVIPDVAMLTGPSLSLRLFLLFNKFNHDTFLNFLFFLGYRRSRERVCGSTACS